MARKKVNREKKGENGIEGSTTDPIHLDTTTEMQSQEMEVLEAIFDQELDRKPSTPLYVHIFTIRVQCASPPPSNAIAEVLLHFDLPRGYPLKQIPIIEVEKRQGLSDVEVTVLTDELGMLAREKVGDVMIYDLVTHATEYVAEHVKDQSSFFDQMVQRQATRESEQQRTEAILRQRIEDEALAKNQEIQAIIDAERRKKQALTKKSKQSARRRRRRHGSSVDLLEPTMRSDGSDDACSGLDSNAEYDVEDRENIHGGERWPSDRDESSSNEDEEDPDMLTVQLDHPNSRYHTDFKELGILGRGGGGEVVKVQNRLDRQWYAIKKIKLDPQDPKMKKKILREVKTISRMQHRHIVRYFQAWIEGDVGGDDDTDDDSEFEEEEGRGDSSGDITSGIDQCQLTCDKSEDEEEDDDWLGAMNKSMHLWSNSTSKRRSRRGMDSYMPDSYMEIAPMDDGFDWEPLDDAAAIMTKQPVGALSSIPQKKKGEKLYIQMEFCEGKALREVIDKGGLWKDPDKIWTLFRQILEGVVYIHLQGIIHRDIKPPNIFLDAEGTVKLGDFGLAVRPQKVIVNDEEDDGDTAAHSVTTVHSTIGSSVAELYGKLRLENLESTQMVATTVEMSSRTTASYDVGDSITAGVGTAFYRAPEQEQGGQLYDQKADMFSLGILFFEMWSPPFTTHMERAQALTQLREEHILPTTFMNNVSNNTMSSNVKRIILWLCEQNPKARPTASDLLASALIPAKMEIEGSYLREALETLANPQGKFFGQLIDALLTQDPVNHVDYTYDHLETVKLRSYVTEMRTKTFVQSVLRRIFERHGALEHSTPLLMPRAKSHNSTNVTLTPQSACALVDSNGIAVTLPFDLTERLARFVARHNITRFKCYQFDRVYRRSVVGGHPRELIEADFDILWDDRGAFRFLELECLQVVAEVMAALSHTAAIGSYNLRLNDVRITRAIVDLCNVSINGRREVLKLWSHEVSLHIHAGIPSRTVPSFKAGRWKFITKKLKEHGVSTAAIDSCRPFFLLPVDSIAALDIIEIEIQKQLHRRLAALQDKEYQVDLNTDMPLQKQLQKQEAHIRRIVKDANDGIAALRNLLQGFEFLRLSGPMCTRLDIGLSPRPERFATGFIFQAVLSGVGGVHGGSQVLSNVSRQRATSSFATNSLVIAEGGRYDQLVTRFKLPAAYTKNTPVAAMGVRFSLDKMVSCILASTCASSSGINNVSDMSSKCDAVVTGGRCVLVCSVGKASDTVLLRMQIALLLWTHGIGADYLQPDLMHLEDLEEYCAQQRIQWMVIVQTHVMREKKQVKVRTVRNPSEGDVVVNCAALVEYLQDRFTLSSGKGHQSDACHHNSFVNFEGAMGINSGVLSGTGVGGSDSHSSVVAQPLLFDVRVVDGKHYTKENRNNKQQENQKVVRRVSKWITSSFSARGDDAMRVLSVDLPFGLLRELSSALMDHGAAGIETVVGKYPRHRKQIRYTADEILALEPTAGRGVGRERYVLLHSLVDDRYDLTSLVQRSSATSTSVNATVNSSHASLGGGVSRKGDRDNRYFNRRNA